MTAESGFIPLFDGSTLAGWEVIPRSYGRLYRGGPDVLDVLTDFPHGATCESRSCEPHGITHQPDGEEKRQHAYP